MQAPNFKHPSGTTKKLLQTRRGCPKARKSKTWICSLRRRLVSGPAISMVHSSQLILGLVVSLRTVYAKLTEVKLSILLLATHIHLGACLGANSQVAVGCPRKERTKGGRGPCVNSDKICSLRRGFPRNAPTKGGSPV